MSNIKPVLCTCCSALITAPQFHKGKAYGYSCILKVVPSYKRERDTGLWVSADEGSVEHVRDGEGIYIVSTCTINGVKVVVRGGTIDRETFINTGEVLPSMSDRNLIRDGLLKIAKFKNGTDTLFNNFEVVQETDKKGKKFPVSVMHYTKTGKTLLCNL